jgi:hypothetical protein
VIADEDEALIGVEMREPFDAVHTPQRFGADVDPGGAESTLQEAHDAVDALRFVGAANEADLPEFNRA